MGCVSRGGGAIRLLAVFIANDLEGIISLSVKQAMLCFDALLICFAIARAGPRRAETSRTTLGILTQPNYKDTLYAQISLR